MKFLVSQVSYFLSQRESKRNLRALIKYLVFLGLIIAAYTVTFHLIMPYAGLSGLYWTLPVMTTLGFGDITFESDIR